MVEKWSGAYLRQARSDYKTLQLLIDNNVDLCQRLHYLQMATEKLGKGLLARRGFLPKRVHSGFVRFLQVSKGELLFQDELGFPPRQYRQYIDSLLPLARQIEELAPVGNEDRPNPEYPWESEGVVIAPVDYSFAGMDVDGRTMAKMLQFIGDCFVIA